MGIDYHHLVLLGNLKTSQSVFKKNKRRKANLQNDNFRCQGTVFESNLHSKGACKLPFLYASYSQRGKLQLVQKIRGLRLFRRKRDIQTPEFVAKMIVLLKQVVLPLVLFSFSASGFDEFDSSRSAAVFLQAT